MKTSRESGGDYSSRESWQQVLGNAIEIVVKRVLIRQADRRGGWGAAAANAAKTMGSR